jgi:phage terminase small subunit
VKLTLKQELFISEYCIDLNATQAYKRAGYSVKSDDVACVNAMRLLGNARIKEEIDKRLLKRANDNGVTADMVLKDLVELKDKCLGRKPITVTQYNDKGKLEDVEKTIFDATGAKSSLELLGKHLKLFTDKTEVSGSLGVQIVDDIE